MNHFSRCPSAQCSTHPALFLDALAFVLSTSARTALFQSDTGFWFGRCGVAISLSPQYEKTSEQKQVNVRDRERCSEGGDWKSRSRLCRESTRFLGWRPTTSIRMVIKLMWNLKRETNNNLGDMSACRRTNAAARGNIVEHVQRAMIIGQRSHAAGCGKCMVDQVCQLKSRQRALKRSAEAENDVPFVQLHESIVKAAKAIPQQIVSERILEQFIDVPVLVVRNCVRSHFWTNR